jgi:two-component system, response regulator / RNA-binding antiterminator
VLKALRDIRSVRVLVLHPKDRECDELVAQIRRIGCRVEAVWPPQNDIPSDTDIVFVLFRQDAITTALAKEFAERNATMTLIGIVEFESPAVIETVVRAGTSAVITKPIRAFGLLTSIIVAHTLNDRIRLASDRISKLKFRLLALKQIEQAKAILIARKGISEQEAYDAIRMRAMSKRMTMEAVCAAIIEANEVFGD